MTLDLWYYQKNGEPVGGFTLDQLRYVASIGYLTSDDLVIGPGIVNWQLARAVPALSVCWPARDVPPPLPTATQPVAPQPATPRLPAPPESPKGELRRAVSNEFAAWYYGAGVGPLLVAYHELNRQFPRFMVAAHLTVAGLFLFLVVVGLLVGPPDPPGGTSTTAPTNAGSHSLFLTQPSGAVKRLPVRISARRSEIGKGVVLQLANQSIDRLNGLTVRVKGRVLSANSTVTMESLGHVEIGWKELNNFVVRPGQTVTLTCPGYADLIQTVPLAP
jgi:hypothetical protein